MAEEEISAEITVEPYVGPEPAFEPAEALKVELRLEPRPEEKPYVPPPTQYLPVPPPKPVRKSVVLNIETTGLLPWESRVISITMKDPMFPEKRPIVLIHPDEEELLKQFVNVYEEQGYNDIIGYNVSFDWRFLFVTAMRYRIITPTLPEAELMDMMQAMKQVRTEYVFGFNKPGTLNDWALYLYGERPPVTQADVLRAWARKDFDTIGKFSEWKVEMTYLIWALYEYTKGMAALAPELMTAEVKGGSEHDMVAAICPYCYQENFVPVGQEEYVCDVCGRRHETPKP